MLLPATAVNVPRHREDPLIPASVTFLLACLPWILLSCLHTSAVVLAGSKGVDSPQRSSLRPGYTGDQSCVSCHAPQSLSYVHTAHHFTSQLPDAMSVLGSTAQGSNLLKIADPAPIIGDPGVSYRMEKQGSSYFMTALTGFEGQMQQRREQIGVVIGSGVRGQSYLYWKGDQLFELPVSYWSDGHQWINSPGYRNGPPNFDRPASPRCLECHVGFIQALAPDPASNRYNAGSLTAGVSCEVCHGPGAQHAAAHAGGGSKTSPGAGEMILNPAHFSRDRQVDLCALCHNGAGQRQIAPAFTYVPGTPLNRYLAESTEAEDLHPDVHANQVGLLKRSRCYLSSPNMTCSTCHEVHSPERGAASYSSRCLTCHSVESCGVEKKLGPSIAANCIDCHMPVQQTQAIVSQTADKVIRTSMRTHWIKVYATSDEP